MSSLEWSRLIDSLKGGLIISVQKDTGSPLDDPAIIAALAETVALPGCVGLRMNEPKNISAARPRVRQPILGIYKMYLPTGRVLIIPTFEMARALVEAGADVIALDATDLPRPAGQSVPELIARIHAELDRPVMADISTYAEGIAAAAAGADLVATTLSGYIQQPGADPLDPPRSRTGPPVVEHAQRAGDSRGTLQHPRPGLPGYQSGAHAVVVGSAITRPEFIARMFIQQIKPGN